MERQRHAKDIAHPTYDIIDNATSAPVDCYYTIQRLTMTIFIIFLTDNSLVFHPEYSQEQ